MHRIIFEIGPFTLYSYGLVVSFAFLLGTILVVRDAGRYGMPVDSVFDTMIAVLAGGLVGGRILFVLVNWDHYSRDLFGIFKFYEGGLAIQGALLGAVLAGVAVTRARKISFWRTSDLIAPYIALGQSIGRIGCFLNGCCYGKVIEGGLGVTFPGETVMRIPVQLYSSLGLLVIFAVLIRLRNRPHFDGLIFTMYLILYSGFRFFMDFMRADNPAALYNMTLAQLISIGMLVCGAGLYVWLRRIGDRSYLS